MAGNCVAIAQTISDRKALENTTASLAIEVQQIAPAEPFWALITLAPREGWHTYWYNPGDSGLGLQLKWTLPAGFTTEPMLSPVPEVIDLNPLVNYGYDGVSQYLVRVTPPAVLNAESVTLSVKASWLVCDEICIPEDANLSITVPVGQTPIVDEATRAAIVAAQQRLPVPFPGMIRHEQRDLDSVVIVGGLAVDSLDKAYLFHNDAAQFRHTLQQTFSVGADGTLRLTLPRHHQEGKAFSGVLHLTFNDSHEAIYDMTVPAPDLSPVSAEAATLSLGMAILFAALGGLILNLMPCVFPVISLKLFALLKGHLAPAPMRAECLWYSAGVLLCFLGLAGLLLVLQASVGNVGWGFQLQSPVFITLLTFLFFLIGLNLLGVFELPSLLANTGQHASSKEGWLASFATGALAVIVATPCTAPFMAPALWFAFAQPPAITATVMLAMGIGFAAPYLAIAAYPPVARLLPKPGAWLLRLKQFMAFPMFGTVIWLLTVLAGQATIAAVFILLSAMLLLALVFWIWAPFKGKSLSVTGKILWALAVVAIFIGTLTALPKMPSSTAASPTGLGAEPFSRERLNTALADGRTVFVNATADWCVTCKVNEATTLHRQDVQAAFLAADVLYLVADWTNRDAAIYSYLQEFSRNGVPLYVVYKAGQEPLILPQILTPAIVRDALAD